MLGCEGDEVSIMSIVYPCGLVSVLSLSYFLSVVSSSKPSHYSLLISIGAQHIQDYFNNKRGRELKSIKIQKDKESRKDRRKKIRVVV